MLQFNAAMCVATSRFTPRLCWRFTALFATSATQPLAGQSNTAVKSNRESTSDTNMTKEQCIKFGNLKTEIAESVNANSSVVSKIQNASNVQDLLSIIKRPNLSKEEILKVMATIIEWVNQNNKSHKYYRSNEDYKDYKSNESYKSNDSYKSNESYQGYKDYKGDKSNESNKTDESVSRIQQSEKSVQIQDQVNKTIGTNILYNRDSDDFDLSEYSDLSTSAIVKEIEELRIKNNRNVKLLKYFYDNIIAYNNKLGIGKCSNLLYSMSVLKYPSATLLDQISDNVISVSSEQKISSLFSITKSMAFLRYKNKSFLDCVSSIVNKSKVKINEKSIANLLHSFAVLGYESENTNKIIEKYMPHLSVNILGADEWLNFVWSLAILKQLQPSQAKSVLNNNFIKNLILTNSEKNLSKQLKLLNINGYARLLLKGYTGPFLDDSQLAVNLNPSKQKELYIKALEDTLKVMIPKQYFSMNVNTKMGFNLDAECNVDDEFEPIISTNNAANKNHNKLAIMIHDYHTYCLESTELPGLIKLYERLLIANGYNVFNLSYKYFDMEDNISKRISILRRRVQLNETKVT